ncbi:MAG: ABC transporter ATP-binding protein [bacterium]|nr:ABC transporter ATP-binding protein [bacterium]
MPAAIKIEGLNKIFRVGFWGRRFEAVKDLDFEVGAGELFGFLGPNGAGKTTTIKMIMGLLYPTRGQAWILGKNSRDVAIRARVGYLPESPYFYDHLKGAEFLDFYGKLFAIPAPKRRKKIGELLELVGITRAADLPLRKYSKGMLQRIGLAQALINDPELIVLDEPMTGLDPVGRREIRDIILKLKQEGKTVFFSTHILPDVEMICDRIAILNQGRLVNIGPLGSLLSPRVKYYEISFSGLAGEKLKDLSAWVSNILQDGALTRARVEKEDDKDRIISWILKEKGRVDSVLSHRESLEEYFLGQVDINNADKRG